MADVFISYKREDFDRVQPLAESLTAEGFTTWWDVQIPGGAAWRQAIEQELDRARCVVVVWSARSVESAGEFVQDEASHARKRGVYLPIRIDPVPPPLGFRQIQVLSLVGWDGRRQAADFIALAASVRAMVSGRDVSPRGDAAPAGKASAPEHRPTWSRPRIAVLDMATPGLDPAPTEFAKALADDLISGLSKSPLLILTRRQITPTVHGTAQSISTEFAQLGADYLIHGKIRSLGGKLRGSVDLLYGMDEASLWSARYDWPLDDLWSALDTTTGLIVGALESAVIQHEEARAMRTAEPDLGFWGLFLRGRQFFWRSTDEDVIKAEEYLSRALALEPDDASTLALLAHCKLYGVWVGASADPSKDIAEAHRIALKAVGASPVDAFAHYTLGVVLSMGHLNQAEAEQRRALELDPYLAAAAGELGRLLAYAGKSEDAIAYSDRAIAASPNDSHAWLWYRNKAVARFIAGDYQAAARDAADACARGPHRYYLHLLLAACYGAGGRPTEARKAFDSAQDLARQGVSSKGRAATQGEDRPIDSLGSLKQGHPFVHPEHLERFVAAVRLAGVGEDDPDGRIEAAARAPQREG